MVIRDPAHAIRISTQKPLHLEQEFGAVYSELIGNRHSLISDIQNSGKWRLQLEAMERECLRIPALSREGAMKCVLRHLSMAKQRMEKNNAKQSKAKQAKQSKAKQASKQSKTSKQAMQAGKARQANKQSKPSKPCKLRNRSAS